MRKNLVSLLLMMMVAVVSVPTLSTTATGQSALREDQKAVFAFDIRMKKMMDGDFVKQMGGADAMQLPPGAMPPDFDPKKIDRIFGAINLPDNVQTFMDMQAAPPETLPMEMYITIKMVDKEATDKMFADMEEDSETVTIGGKKYYKPPAGQGAPDNLMAHRLNDTTIEFGTTNYMTQASKRGLFSKGLDAAWKKVPDDNLRLAFDIAGASKLVNEAIQMGKQGADPMTAGFMDLIPKMKNLRFSIDMDKQNILTLASSGVNEDGAEEIRGGLDAILGMAKLGGMNGANAIPDKDVAEVAKALLNSLKAKRAGTDVTVAIPKPEGFAPAMKKMGQMIPMMMMGGMGGPPPGADFDR